jgi:hypothetical protein
MRSLDAGTARQERRGRVATLENLTIFLPRTHVVGVDSKRDQEVHPMRLIVALTAGLTVVLLILPVHP